MQDLPWRNIWSADNPVDVLNEHLLLLVLRFVPTKVIRVRNKINIGLMINAGMLLASSRRLIFGGPVIALGLTGKSLSAVMWELMKPTRRPSVRLVPETAMFLWMPSLLISGGPLLSLLCSAWVRHCHRLLVEVVDCCESRLARLICSRIILMASSPGNLLTCRSFAIILRHLPPLPSGRVRSGFSCWTCTLMEALTNWVCFLFFLRVQLMFWPLDLGNVSVVCRRLVRLGSFPAFWRQANVTPIPNGPPSSSVAKYQPISITSVLSKVFERLVSVRLGRFMERSGVLPTTQFAYQKYLRTCDALLCVSHTLQSALESGREARIVQIDFRSAFHRVNHIDHSTLWWTVGRVNWLTSCQECRRAVFLFVIVPPIHLGAFFHSGE